MDFIPEVYGGPWHYLLWVGASSFWTPKESFCTCAVSPLPQGWEMWDLLIFYSNRIQSVSVPAVTVKVSTGDKVQLFTLFLLLFLTQSANRRLIVNI